MHITPAQLATLETLSTFDGCATLADLVLSVEHQTTYNRMTARCCVVDLIADGLLWQEGELVGMTSEAFKAVG